MITVMTNKLMKRRLKMREVMLRVKEECSGHHVLPGVASPTSPHNLSPLTPSSPPPEDLDMVSVWFFTAVYLLVLPFSLLTLQPSSFNLRRQPPRKRLSPYILNLIKQIEAVSNGSTQSLLYIVLATRLNVCI